MKKNFMLLLGLLMIVSSCSVDSVTSETILETEAKAINTKLQNIAETPISKKDKEKLISQLEIEFSTDLLAKSSSVCSATTSNGNTLEIFYEGWGMYSYTITNSDGDSVSGGNYFYLTMVVSGWCEGLVN